MSNYKTRLDQLEGNAPGAYEKSGAVLDAQKALSDYEGKKPGAYTSKYQSQLDGLLDKLSNRKFDYDFNKDALYQQYKDKYTEQGRQAAVNAAASASALTGGYGNSYATSAAAQANQQYMTELNDRIPELYQLAMARYQNEGNDLTSLYGLYQGADATDYGRYQDGVTDFYNYLNYLTQKENTAYTRDYTEWGDKVNRYNTDRDYLYTGYRGDVADEQWAKELAEQQRQYDATMAENRRQFDANLALSREELAYKQAAAAAAAKAVGTGTSKSGKSTGKSKSGSKSKSSSAGKKTFSTPLTQQVAFDRALASRSSQPANAPLSNKGRAEYAAQSAAVNGLTGAQAYSALTRQYPRLSAKEKDAALKKFYG